MKPSQALYTHRDEIHQLMAQYRLQNVRIFGSVLHGTDTSQSDLDLLVDPAPDTTLMDLAAVQIGLKKLLGIPVEVLTPGDLPLKFRKTVIEEARPL
jgi:uncharacterized protein